MRINKIFSIGLVIVGVTLLVNRFIEIPDILYGFLFGISITCEVMGVLISNKEHKK
jgi:hypothetical protein